MNRLETVIASGTRDACPGACRITIEDSGKDRPIPVPDLVRTRVSGHQR